MLDKFILLFRAFKGRRVSTIDKFVRMGLSVIWLNYILAQAVMHIDSHFSPPSHPEPSLVTRGVVLGGWTIAGMWCIPEYRRTSTKVFVETPGG